MQKILGFLVLLFLPAVSARAQYFYNSSSSTLYNKVTVSINVSAGISNDPDYSDCGPVNNPPPYPYTLSGVSWLVTSSAGLHDGPGGSAAASQIQSAPLCDWNYTGQDNE